MSHLESNTSLAGMLAKAGYKKTPLAVSIAEVVGSYLGLQHIQGEILKNLQKTQQETAEIIQASESSQGQDSTITDSQPQKKSV